MKEKVILLHGIFRTHRNMARLAGFLEERGFEVLNLGYPSTKFSLEQLVDVIRPSIAAFTAGSEQKVHFVGFSMGGLLVRAYLCKYRPAQLGRVVMLGTPNGGSEVADFLQNIRLYKWLYGPAGQQLITQQGAFAHCFGCVDYELGVIAGNRTIDPFCSRLIGKPNDGKVSIASTKIEGMKDHIVISATHTFFPSNKTAWQQTLAFIQNGQFARSGV